MQCILMHYSVTAAYLDSRDSLRWLGQQEGKVRSGCVIYKKKLVPLYKQAGKPVKISGEFPPGEDSSEYQRLKTVNMMLYLVSLTGSIPPRNIYPSAGGFTTGLQYVSCGCGDFLSSQSSSWDSRKLLFASQITALRIISCKATDLCFYISAFVLIIQMRYITCLLVS